MHFSKVEPSEYNIWRKLLNTYKVAFFYCSYNSSLLFKVNFIKKKFHFMIVLKTTNWYKRDIEGTSMFVTEMYLFPESTLNAFSWNSNVISPEGWDRSWLIYYIPFRKHSAKCSNQITRFLLLTCLNCESLCWRYVQGIQSEYIPCIIFFLD